VYEKKRPKYNKYLGQFNVGPRGLELLLIIN